MSLVGSQSSLRRPGRRQRKCGAWALEWVYRIFDIEVDTCTLWPKISSEDQFGSEAVASHALARDAIERGLDAATLGAKNPWALLRRAPRLSPGVIVCHRLRDGSKLGHFSVVEEVTDRTICLRDRGHGLRIIPRNQFLDSWMNAQSDDEFGSGILIVIKKPDSSTLSTQHIDTMGCRRCGGVIPLKPQALFFGQRDWATFFCPTCDAAHG